MNMRIDMAGFGKATATVALFAVAVAAQASTISGNINTSSSFSPTNLETDGLTYAGSPNGSGFPAAAVEIGEFDFSVAAGQSIVGATVSGFFGNQDSFSTAGVNLFLNGVAVGSCAPGAQCNSDAVTGETAWSYTFSAADLAALLSGQAILSGVQLNPSQIVLDATTVTIQTAPVPLPGAALLFGSGLLSLLGFGRKNGAARA